MAKSKVDPKSVNATPEKKKIGRDRMPFNQEACDELCEVIATSEIGINRLLKERPHLPAITTFYKWMEEHPSFAKQYARAKSDQADFMAEKMLEIADDSDGDRIATDTGVIENREFVSRSRLRVDARKWLMSKLAPKKYGENMRDADDTATLPPPPNITINIPSDVADKHKRPTKK